MKDPTNPISYEHFIASLRNAWEALGAVKVHVFGPPGIRGLMENLWQCCGFESEDQFLKTIYPGWPNSTKL